MFNSHVWIKCTQNAKFVTKSNICLSSHCRAHIILRNILGNWKKSEQNLKLRHRCVWHYQKRRTNFHSYRWGLTPHVRMYANLVTHPALNLSRNFRHTCLNDRFKHEGALEHQIILSSQGSLPLTHGRW